MNTSTGSLTPDFPLCINIYTIRALSEAFLGSIRQAARPGIQLND
jgi:hypothetical protein